MTNSDFHRSAGSESAADTEMYRLRDLIAPHMACQEDCQKYPVGCGCALTAARAVMNAPAQSAQVTDDELYRLAVEAWESQTSYSWYPDAMDAVVLAIRERLASQPSPDAPVEECPRPVIPDHSAQACVESGNCGCGHNGSSAETAVERFQKRIVADMQAGFTGFHLSTGDDWHSLDIEQKCAAILEMWDAPKTGDGLPVRTTKEPVDIREFVKQFADEPQEVKVPWKGNLSVDLRKGALRINADGVTLIDEAGTCWAIVFPDKTGSYEHAATITSLLSRPHLARGDK